MSELKNTLENFFRRENLSCLACGKDLFDGSFLCATCQENFPFNDGAVCLKCGRKQAEEEMCMECRSFLPAFEMARSALCHTGSGKKMLLRYKKGRRHLEEFLGKQLFLTYQTHFSHVAFDGVTFVPLSPKDYAARGFSPAEDLSKILSKLTGLPLLPLLKKVRKTRKQKELPAPARAKNLKNCFACGDAKGKTLLLIDDVMTTGATANEAVNALKKKGAKAVYLLTVTSVPYQPPLSTETRADE